MDSTNKRIAKNTALLYVRTVLTILISLYTSRVILDVLGETNFGIYNVVGGVVVLFSFISNALTSATQRFLNFELGCGDEKSISKLFSLSLTAHISMALVVLVIAETIGLWFVNTQLNIPPTKEYAMMWAYQCSVLITCINIIVIPYNAIIVAHERMGYYAYLSILESVLKLAIVYVLLIVSQDKLIAYSLLLVGVSLIKSMCLKVYANRKFTTSRYIFAWDWSLYKKLMSFSGWSLFGSAANVGVSQGVNILINIFYGVSVNAAMGVARQVQSSVSSFVGNFQTAFNPPLVKSYAKGDNEGFIRMICNTSRMSFFLIYVLAFPLIVGANKIMSIWLKEVPQYAVPLTQVMLVMVIVGALITPLWTAVQAVGRIKNYQIIVSIIIFLNLPVIYLCFKNNLSPVWALIVRTCVDLITYAFRLIYLRKLVRFPILQYLKLVIAPCLFIIASSVLTTTLLCKITPYNEDNLVVIFVSAIVNFIFIFYIGLTSTERNFIFDKVRDVTTRFK
ncbi:MAG: oligosaccharide flippase family protein [Rikenellaceae bacterium]